MSPMFFYAAEGHGTSLERATGWIESLLLGQVGATIAVLAVALAGLNMLSGRLSLKAGLRVILGCFILFGAPAIAQGLANAIQESSPPEIVLPPQVTVPAPIPKMPPPPTANPFDPYTNAPSAN